MRRIYEQLAPLESIDDLFSLDGQVGLIVGGAGGMGKHFAKVLSKAGARIVVSDLKADACEKIACDIEAQTGRKALGIACDASDEQQVCSLFERLNTEFGQLDFLISCLMAKPPGYYRNFDNYSIKTWRKVLDINLTGTFLCCREAYRLMNKNKNGSIVLVSSIYGMVGPDQRIYDNCQVAENPYGGSSPLNTPGAYSASKGGLTAFARYLATHQQSQNIRVNLLTPGGVFDDQEDAFHKAYNKRTPMGRMAVWSDYSGAILFLVSEASRYMTGANLVVDGGWTAW